MAAANITSLGDTIGELAYTIECTSSQFSVVTGGVQGFLMNVGLKTVYVNFAGATVNADGAQRAHEVPIIAGMTYPIPSRCSTFTHKCAGSDTTTLVFAPKVRL